MSSDVSSHSTDTTRPAGRPDDSWAYLQAQLQELEHAITCLETETAGRQVLKELERLGTNLMTRLEAGQGNLSRPPLGEQGRMTAELLQERNLLRMLIDALPDYVFIKDTHSRFVINNMAHTRALGASNQDEVVGKTDFDIFPKELAEQYYADEQAVIRSGQPLVDREEPYINPAGAQRWLSTTKVPLQDAHGNAIGLVGISRDVTERKRVEEALQASEGRFALAVRGTNDGVWDWDIQNETLYWSPRLKELLGYAEDEIDVDFDTFNSLMHPDDQAHTGAAIEAHLRDRSLYDVEQRLRAKSGEYRWFHVRGQAIWDEAGQPVRMVGSSTDITERKAAEAERSRLLADLERRSRQLQTAAEVAHAVTSILNPDELIQQVVNLVQERFDLYYAGLFLIDQIGEWTGEPGKWAVLRAGTGEAGRHMLKAAHKLEIGSTSMIGWCVANARARIALDVGEEAAHFSNPWLPETHSEMALPLIARGQVIGAMTIQSTRVAAFSDEDIAVLQTMADQLAVAIENARLFDQAHKELAERKLIEDELRSSRGFLNGIINAIEDPVFAKDEQHRFALLNDALCKLLGHPREGLIGKSDYDFSPKEEADAFWEKDDLVFKTGETNVSEEAHTSSDESRWISTKKSLYRDPVTGNKYIVGVIRDLTQRRRMEDMLAQERELLRALLDNMPDLIFFKDAESRIIRSNKAHAQFLGLTDPNDGIGKTDFDLFSPEDAPRFYAEEQTIIRSGQPIINREAQTPDLHTGEVRWLSETKVPLRDENGQVSGLVGIARDITERKQSEIELKRRTAQLQTAAEVSRAASSILNLDELIRQVVNLVQERFGLYYVGLFLVDETGDWSGEPGKWAVLRAGSGEAGRQMLEAGHKLEIGGNSMIGWCAANRQARIALDVGEEAVRFENPWLPETRSELALPLVSRQQLIGAMTIQSVKEAAFSDEDISVLQTMADQLAVAIENAHLLSETQKALQEARSAHQQYLHREWASFLANRKDQAGVGYVLTRDGLTAAPEVWSPEIELAMQSQDVVVVADDHGVPLAGSNGQEAENVFAPAIQARSALAAPITLRGQVIGALDVFDPDQSREWSDDELSLVDAVASQVALAVENARLFEQTQTSLAETEALYRASRRITSSVDLPVLYKTLVDEIAVHLGANQCCLEIFDKEKAYSETVAEYRPTHEEEKTPVPLVISPAYTILRQIGEPLVVEDVSECQMIGRLKEELVKRNVKSILLVPLMMRGELIGSLQVETTDRKRAFSEAELDFCQTVVGQATISIENMRTFVEIQRRADELGMLFNVSRSLASAPLESEEIAAIITRQFVEVMKGPECSLSLLDAQERTLRVVADVYVEEGDEKPVKQERIGNIYRLSDYPAIARAIQSLQPLVVHASDPQADPAEVAYMRKYEMGSLLVIPLAVKGEAVGIIELGTPGKEHHYTSQELSLAMTLANQAAVVLENARLYEEQRHTAERLREVDKLRTQFLANMSHELRTPLNSIIGFSRVILKGIDGPLTEMQQTDLGAIYNSGQHLLGLINDILDMSKIEAGKMELNFDEVDLKPIIKGVMSTAIGLVKDKPITLEHYVPEDLPSIWADGTRVRQVLLNLVSNATKFTETGKITLSAEYGAEWVDIKVIDTGTGIPKDKLESIFEEFTQVDGSTTRAVGGTGLGLPITRHFVEMHGGTITVESELDVGSTFSIRLPIHAQAEPADESDAERGEDGTSTTARRVVLAVDDDPGVISLYRRYLEGEGYQVVGVSKSEEVLGKAAELQPFAITLDVLMPDKDGWQVLRELKEHPATQHIPIIICSIVSEEGRGFSLGAADYLVKPIMEEELLAALSRLDELEEESLVLVIDDQADDILLIRRILEAQHSYRVIEASGGQAGIDLVHQRKPDVVILDLMMPEVDGFTVLEMLKREPNTRNIPVIVITAKELTEEEQELLLGQVEVLLHKGLFTESELLEDLKEALGRIAAPQSEYGGAR
jgi:PAS domain S-box-containing protein